MIDRLISHYRITSEIGAGGMGVVYRAEDTRLRRDVAFKVLPEEMAGEPERLARFQREARTVAALNHPNIVTIHSVEEADGLHFLTMELVVGQGLDALQPADGFELDRFFDLALPIADAVASAHARGIVHRDLKPANVMVTDEGARVKVLDFGLAKLADPGPGDGPAELSRLETMTRTQDGLVIGTPQYMSPEQAKGEATDHRSDIFSLGVMFFEMVTGRRPFSGASPIELMSAVLKDPAPPVSDIRPQLPRHLGRIVGRCLEKAPEDRYQTARDVFNELRGLREEASSASPGAATARPPSAVAHSTEGPPPSPDRVFVGRDAERAKLDDMLSSAAAGRGALVLLSGEPGVGKTRLATEILEDGRERGMLALTGHAYEDETAPFIISTEILEEMVRLVPESELRTMLGVNASELSRFLPELRQLYADIPEPADMPPEMQQRHLFKSVLEFLSRAAARRPMVMLFDDLHWADESSLGLLEHIAPRLEELPILMIGTYRTVEADIGEPFARSMATLVRQRLAERLSIDPFDESSVAEILAALGGSAPPSGLAHAIHKATEGNVFFIEESFRHLSEEGRLFDERGGWRADLDVEHLDVPEGVRLVTARRLERLGASTRKILSLASVIGLRFPVRVLEAAAADADAVLDALEEAEAAHLLQPATGGRELRYEFVHALARQTLLGDLSRLRQQRMHLVIADAIEQTAAGQAGRWAADLAHHLLEAGSSADPERTVGWLKTAGDNAFAAAAMEEAAQYFGAALSLIDDEQKEARADLLHRRGSVRRSLGQLDDFLADLVEAFAGFKALGLGEKAAPLAEELATILAWLARQDEALVIVSTGLDLVPDEQSASRCRLLSAQGVALSNAGRAADSGRAHQAAVATARTLDSPRLLATVLQNHGWDAWHRFDGVAAERVAREAAAIHRDLGQEWNLSQSLVVQQAGLTLTGRYDEAERINDELLPIAQRHEDLGALGVSAMMNGLIQQAHGNIAESSQHLRRSVDLFETGGLPWAPLLVSSYSVNALLADEVDEARKALESIAAKGVPPSAWIGADLGAALSGKATLGDPDTYSLFESHREEVPVEGQVMASGSVLLLLATIEALVLIGRDDEAALHYPAVRTFVASGCGVQTFTYGLTERFAGMAAAAARDWDAAETHFRTALDLAEALPHRVDQARVRYWFARMLLSRDASGDRERARTLLAEARVLSQVMELHGLIRWIDELAAELQASEGGSVAPTVNEQRTAERAGAPPPTSCIAVLPLADHSPSGDQDWFAAGVHEALLRALQQIAALRVTSRTSAMRYRGTDKLLPEIAAELGVEWLVEGAVICVDDRVRISAQLIEAATDHQAWSGQYERDVRDVLTLQSEVAQAIASEIHVALTPEEEARLAAAPQVDPVTYEAYVRGLQHSDRVTPAGFRKCVESFEQAIVADPTFVPAHAALAIAHGIAAEYGWIDRAQAAPRAARAADVALELAPRSSDAHHARASVAFHMDRDFATAEASYRRALELGASATIYFGYGWLLSQSNRHDEAVEALERAVELDPRSPLMHSDLGWWLYGARRDDRAIEEGRIAIGLDPQQPESYWLLAAAQSQKGLHDEALDSFTRYEQLYGDALPWFRGYLLALAGRREAAIEALEELEGRVERGESPSIELAQVHLGLGDDERVLDVLERAEGAGVSFQPYLWPEYERLLGEPRFLRVLERLGYPSPGAAPTPAA